jgi:hypothetical protein
MESESVMINKPVELNNAKTSDTNENNESSSSATTEGKHNENDENDAVVGLSILTNVRINADGASSIIKDSSSTSTIPTDRSTNGNTNISKSRSDDSDSDSGSISSSPSQRVSSSKSSSKKKKKLAKKRRRGNSSDAKYSKRHRVKEPESDPEEMNTSDNHAQEKDLTSPLSSSSSAQQMGSEKEQSKDRKTLEKSSPLGENRVSTEFE